MSVFGRSLESRRGEDIEAIKREASEQNRRQMEEERREVELRERIRLIESTSRASLMAQFEF